MDSLISNNQAFVTRVQPTASTIVPLKWINVLHLHLAGHTTKEIAAATDYTENSVWRILHHKDVTMLRQQLLKDTQKEFEALFSRIVDSVRDDLNSGDPDRISDARKDWLKAHGKVLDNSNIQVNITAENVVSQILNGKANE
jgi:hypothetical protein